MPTPSYNTGSVGKVAFQLSRRGGRPLPATLTAYHEQIRIWTEEMKRLRPEAK